MEKLVIDGVEIEVYKKKIKNLYIRITPPSGKVCISAPYMMKIAEIKQFARSKIRWIQTHQKKHLEKTYQPQLLFTSGECVYYQGESYTLEVLYSKQNRVEISCGKIILEVKDNTTEQKKKVLYEWYRTMLKMEIPELLEKWQGIIGVKASDWGVKDMKTRWGTCNVKSRKIWLSLRLIQKAPRFLEYVIVHELVHLLEGSHNKIFAGYMDKYLPEWKTIRKELNNGV